MSEKIFLTADSHFGHTNIIKFCSRPFADAKSMDEEMVKRWNSVVGYNDVVYHLGDFSFHRPGVTLAIVHRLNGRIRLIKGNHDKRMKGAILDRFEWVRDYYETDLFKTKIVMSHYPFLSWNKMSRGAWMLHGHCHNNLDRDNSCLRLDVGVDGHDFTPWSVEEIKDLMESKLSKINSVKES